MILKRLKGSSWWGPKPACYLIPDGQRVFAIGDIHGRLDLLEQLLIIIENDDQARGPSETHLVFLGDLVDRGPHSRGVIERLIYLRSNGAKATFLLGNHDEVFRKAATGDAKATRFLTKIGGEQTILSYGVSVEDYETATYEELTRQLVEKVPLSHKEFLATFQDFAEIGDYLFVHAGIRPGVELGSQTGADLRWIRGEFLNHRTDHGKMVIHGHTIFEDPDVQVNRVGIDTGAFASGRLTAIGLEGERHWFLSAVGEPDPRWGQLTD